jgi:hypothetical protein
MVVLDGDSRRLYCGDESVDFTAANLLRGFYDGDLPMVELFDGLEELPTSELAARDWSQDDPEMVAKVERRTGARLTETLALAAE